LERGASSKFNNSDGRNVIELVLDTLIDTLIDTLSLHAPRHSDFSIAGGGSVHASTKRFRRIVFHLGSAFYKRKLGSRCSRCVSAALGR
jgi:hypothetical protein